MEITFHYAKTAEEREQVYRLRYAIYVEEMNIFGDVADHERRLLLGENDQDARLLYAKRGDELVASLRLNLGKDAPFSDELEETYNLQRFRAKVADDKMLVLTRFMLKKEYRGSQLAYRMIEQVAVLCLQEQLDVAVCDCQPHLIRYYQRLGFRSYDCEVYNDPEFGIMIPLAFGVRDLDYLARIRSPLRKALDQPVSDPEHVQDVVETFGTPAVLAVDELAVTDQQQIQQRLAEEDVALFKKLPPEEVRSIISKGHVLSLKEGDLMIQEGQTTATVYVVLSGELQVQSDDAQIRTVQEGEMIGELGFLLNAHRTADVVVASTHARILSIDESRLKKRIRARTPNAAQLLHNLCHILAGRIAGQPVMET